MLIAALLAGGADAAAPPAPAQNSAAPTTRPVRRRINLPATAPVLPGNPIPGITAQHESRQRIRSIYARDYLDTSYAARRLLSRRLIDAAAETRRDLPAKFALLIEARDVAAEAGDIPTAFEAVDELAAAFPVTKLHERIEVLRMAAPVITAATASIATASICLDLADQCVIEGDYERADELLKLASAAAVRGKSVPMFRWIEGRAAAVRPLHAAYEVARPAEQKLQRAPDDPDANLVMGKFVAFVKRDFDAGLDMLAKGSDIDLAKLADADLDNPEKPSQQLQLAGKWWDAAEKYSEHRDAMRLRAGEWYRKASPGLDGLDRALAERRIIELSPPPARVKQKPPRPPDAIRLNGRLYRVHTAEVPWETARRMCEQAGGHLVCIETRAENELMVKLARGRSLWLGAVTEGNARWKWINNAEFFFIYWSSGEPSALTPDFHPMTTSTGAWKTSTGRAGFICEWAD